MKRGPRPLLDVYRRRVEGQFVPPHDLLDVLHLDPGFEGSGAEAGEDGGLPEIREGAPGILLALRAPEGVPQEMQGFFFLLPGEEQVRFD